MLKKYHVATLESKEGSNVNKAPASRVPIADISHPALQGHDLPISLVFSRLKSHVPVVKFGGPRWLMRSRLLGMLEYAKL
jgi:hypothetical protein